MQKYCFYQKKKIFKAQRLNYKQRENDTIKEASAISGTKFKLDLIHIEKKRDASFSD